MRLIDWDAELIAQPCKQGFSHDSHKRCVSHRAMKSLSGQCDFTFVQKLMTSLAERNQIARCVASGLPTLDVVDMEFDFLFRRWVSAAALAGIAVTEQDILPDIVLPEHFAFLIIRTSRER